MILSVSRRTDIPCFYMDWLMNRLRAGYALVRNPYAKGQLTRVPTTPDVTDCMVFWTKDARGLRPHLTELDQLGCRYYVQFTLTPYGRDLERGLRPKSEIAATFQTLSQRLGPDRVIWRYDPVLLTRTYTAAFHQRAFERLCGLLAPFTRQVIISFVDDYARMERHFSAIPEETAAALARSFSETAQKHGLSISACCENSALRAFGIGQAHCIDRDLIARICRGRLRIPEAKTPQRQNCGCIRAIDLGAYHTCRNGCVYCYATDSRAVPCHDPEAPLLSGTALASETIVPYPAKSDLDTQIGLFDL